MSKPLDPTPYLYPLLDYRNWVGGSFAGDWPVWSPRPEYEQDRSKYVE